MSNQMEPSGELEIEPTDIKSADETYPWNPDHIEFTKTIDGETVDGDAYISKSGNVQLYLNNKNMGVKSRDGNEITFHSLFRPNGFNGEKYTGIKLPDHVSDELDEQLEDAEERIETVKEHPLTFTVESKQGGSARTMTYTTYVLNKNRLGMEMSDHQKQVLSALKSANSTEGLNKLEALSSLEEGERYSLDQLKTHYNLPDNFETEDTAPETEDEDVSEDETEDKHPNLSMEVDDKWEKGDGENHRIVARVIVTDDTGTSARYKLKNQVDIGFFINKYDNDDYPDEFDEQAQDFLRNNSPIPTGHRQSPGDRGGRGRTQSRTPVAGYGLGR